MDIKLTNITYDKPNKQVLCSLGGAQLTIPDYMVITDIGYFINEKITQALQSSLNMIAAKNAAQESLVDKAVEHYKSRGW